MKDREAALQEPHRGQPVLTAGPPLSEAGAAMILVHGRGAPAESIVQLGEALERPEFALLAPQAAGYTWYPYSFLAPAEQNEPFLGSALRLLGSVADQVLTAGVSTERLMILGFSQGACLTLEFTARTPRRYGGVVALTGGLIGADDAPRDYPGSLHGTPVFIGTSDPDPHVPITRVEESRRVLEDRGAQVTTRVYPGMGHTVNDDELEHVRAMMDRVLAGAHGG